MLTPTMILDFLRSRKLLWNCFCFSSDPLGHPIAEFVHLGQEEVRVYCQNRMQPCGFYCASSLFNIAAAGIKLGLVNLNQIYMRTDIGNSYDCFQENQTYDDHLGAMCDHLRIDNDNGLIEGWFGTYDDVRLQIGGQWVPL
ncbi:hypothetical protein EST38_g13052 [Candolleomyces aberdarensis]|uniref:Uncharacterized protein n=1 Tax=Candolleomyces aberdarensis TaxID=2316362 RepID=A0A4Q2D3W1_9AGAR|nr:hypothetical protein EST38_g13052 [Candolleomyces aberdarensis]